MALPPTRTRCCKTPLSPQLRDQVVRQRDWARLAARVRRGVDLINDGKVEEGRRLLMEADAENKDPQMHQKIQEILNATAKHPAQ